MSQGDYRPDIEGLRAVAVLSVVAYHLGFPVTGGFAGVDIFFVISGFLISKRIVTSIEAGTFTFRAFYLARVRRILPAMIVTVLLTLIAAAVLMSPGALQDVAGSGLAAVASVSNIYFWLDSGYFTADSSTKALLHTWSLGVEEQFYLVWPLMLVAVAAVSRRALPWIISIAAVISLVAAELMLSASPSSAFFLMPFRICEFGLGAVLVWLIRSGRTGSAMAELGAAIGVAAMLGAVLLIDDSMRSPGVLAMAPCAGAALVILFGTRSRLAQGLLANPASVWLGRISYSLYLVHWPLVVLAEYALRRELTLGEALAALAVCIVLSAGMYVFVEQPFRRRTGGAFLVPHRTLLISVAVLGAVTTLASWNASSTGWMWRLGDRAATFADITSPGKFHTAYFGGADCPLPRCETHPAATKTAYLIGDSHASAYYAGLKLVFPEINFVIFGPNACPLYSLTMSHFNPQTEFCLEAREKAVAELAGAKGPVFMTHHWAVRMSSPHRIDANDTPVGFAGDHAGFAAFVRAQLAAVEQQIGRKIILIGGVPRYGGSRSPLDCISRPIPPENCATSERDGYVEEQHRITEALRPELDPYDFLCDASACRDVDDQGRSLYSDKTHLSVWGSEYLVARMRAAMLSYL